MRQIQLIRRHGSQGKNQIVSEVEELDESVEAQVQFEATLPPLGHGPPRPSVGSIGKGVVVGRPTFLDKL